MFIFKNIKCKIFADSFLSYLADVVRQNGQEKNIQ